LICSSQDADNGNAAISGNVHEAQQTITQGGFMKSGNLDKAEGKLHEVKGAVKETAGKITDNPKLEAEGKVEKLAGKAQVKIGEVKKVLGK
jgi:uncharacterized protein YjbJ (UPF0337 family)